jgi:hypothetical protein
MDQAHRQTRSDKIENPENDIRVAEYESLRQEISQNKRYVFERPLLIIGAAGFSATQVPEHPVALVIPGLLVALLWLNLWFTVNRLMSTSRIVAYIALVLESNNNWIGWENALIRYRQYEKAKALLKQNEKNANNLNSKKQPPDSMWFYHILIWLHAVPAIVSFAISLSYFIKTQEPFTIAGFIFTLILSISFGVACLKPFHPKVFTGMVGIQRDLWCACLKI